MRTRTVMLAALAVLFSLAVLPAHEIIGRSTGQLYWPNWAEFAEILVALDTGASLPVPAAAE